VRLADFGVARDAEATGLTLAGHVVGTPGYLAPEVAAGETATPAADIYSLAVVARELLGDRPALDRALARDPKDRPPSAASLVAELGGGDARTQVLPTRSTRIAPIPVTQVAPPARPARRHRTVRVGFVATLVAALAVGSAAGAAFMAGRLPLPLLHTATDETCAVSPMKHDANVVVRGVDADAFCRSQAGVLQLDGDSWTYRSGGELIAPDHGKSKLAVVCRLHRSRLNATVYDSGSQQIGGDVCSLFASGGWQT